MQCQEIAEAVRNGQPASQEVEAALQRIEENTSNAVIRVHRESALTTASGIADRLAKGETLPLAGVPVVLKDNICYADHETTACSRILSGFKPPYSATVATKLLDAGAIIVGTANMDEFAMGSSNETSFYGRVEHPIDPDRITGGSSGGSAAAVAAGLTPLALGSDTGGSIRQPASLCGTVGFKPTYGRVSRFGLLAFGSSLDQIGPFTNSVADCSLAYQALAGHDPADSTSSTKALGALSSVSLEGLRIGWVPDHSEGLEPDVAARLEEIRGFLQGAGAELVEVAMPHEQYAVAVYYIIATGEASSNLSRYDGVHYGHRSDTVSSLDDIYSNSRGEGFGDEVKRRIMLGTYVLSAGYADKYYKKAMEVRAKICQDYESAFASCDLILGPTAPTTAFKSGEKIDDPLQMYLSDIFTISANLAGIPAMSMPAGMDSKGLPIGIHLQAPQFADERLLGAAQAIEGLLA